MSPARREISIRIPGKPVPKGRARRGKDGKFYTPKATREYEDHVAWCARAQPVRKRFEDQVIGVSIEIWTERTLRGDLDNYAKSVLDGLEKGGLFNNDMQVADLSVRAINGWPKDQEHVSVRVWAL